MNMVKIGGRRSRRATDARVGSIPKRKTSSPSGEDGLEPTARPERNDELAALIDYCTAAQVIAESQGEKFLSYMLAMTLQAARGIKRVRDRA